MRQGHHEGLNVINRTAVQNRKESNNGSVAFEANSRKKN
jgi:hypothetical protein